MHFSSKQLKRDPSETAAELLVVLVSHFNGSDIPSRSELPLGHFIAPPSARVTNAFWFLSLSVALVVSMLAILAKQWITMFSSRMRAPVANFRRWAHVHHVFRDGIDRWHVNAFVSSLSVALHGSVILFLIGLITHLFSRDLIIFGLVLGVTVLATVFYVAATVAPLFDGTCPTATPLLIHGRLACLALLQILRRLFGALSRCSLPQYHRQPTQRPPFDPDVVLSDGDDSHRDVRILTLMLSSLPSGHDVDTVLDAIGAFELKTHDLGGNLTHVRHLARRRLERLASAVDNVSSDTAAVARALRTAVSIESHCERLDWDNFDTLIAGLRSIRTHDTLALSTALQLQLEKKCSSGKSQAQWQEQEQAQEQEQEQKQEQGYASIALVPPAYSSVRLILGVLNQRQRSQQNVDQLQQLLSITDAIAHWNVRLPPASSHSISPRSSACLFNSICGIISAISANQPVSLSLCAALVISFGADINLGQKCHELVTPLTFAALGRERYYRVGGREISAWRPLPDYADWRLRAIDLWAHVTSHLSYLKPSTPLVGEVYAYILAQWSIEDWSRSSLTTIQLRSLILPAEQVNLPAKARATLWNISRLTLKGEESTSLRPGIIRDLLHGVSLGDMVAAHPAIDISIFIFMLAILGKELRGHEMHYQHFVSAHRQLLALVEPSFVTTSPELKTTWEIIHPYLVVSQDEESLADLAADVSIILSIRACMSGDVSALFEQLLGAGIGRRVILSHKNRDKALLVATHARNFAKAWWEKMQSELLQIDPVIGIWKATEGFEDAASFVRKVEEDEPCFDCMQKGRAWLPQLLQKEQ